MYDAADEDCVDGKNILWELMSYRRREPRVLQNGEKDILEGFEGNSAESITEDVRSDKLQLTKIMFGAGVFSGRYHLMKDNWPLEAVRRALELGINGFDTSPFYEDSEIILGDALYALRNDYPRSRYYLSTKVGRYGFLKQDFDYSAQRVEESVTTSIARLKTDYLDVVFAHDVEFVDIEEVVGDDGALSKLFEMKARKSYPLDILLNIAHLQYERNQPLDIILTYCHYNLQNTLLADYAQKFRGVGIKYLLNASPLSMGLLCNDPCPNWHPASPELREAAQKCAKIAQENQLNIAKLALEFSLEWDGVDSTLIGCSNKNEVEEAVALFNNLKARQKARQTRSIQEEQVLEKIAQILAPYHNVTWASPPPE
ncbi:hypothetical protein G9A89_013433 [Geosiphon pyriformis]|nr:hypothetical protein G9A89_013433 [Geosiphon pyriformis]